MAVERIRRRRPVRQRIIEVGRKKVVKVRSRGLFVLPNLFTTASLFCAFISIVQAMEQNFGLAALMIMLSMLFDGMDGRVARLTHTQSEFGVQFDSIADMTAFGVAPALVMYKFCLYTLGGLGWAAAFVYCLCAGVRLARFNCNVGVVDKRFFQGLPSPAAAALLAGFVWLPVHKKKHLYSSSQSSEQITYEAGDSISPDRQTAVSTEVPLMLQGLPLAEERNFSESA